MNINSFATRVKKVGGSLCIIIPRNNVDLTNISEGDIIQVTFNKMPEMTSDSFSGENKTIDLIDNKKEVKENEQRRTTKKN